MGRIITRSYIVDLINKLYVNQENNCYFCQKSSCYFCAASYYFEQQLREKKFNSDNANINEWFMFNLR